MEFKIRPYHPSDLSALYRICLWTGDSGKDARNLYQDPDLLGHIFTAPYAVFEPELCFVVTHGGKPCGYILGTRDTKSFYSRCETDWLPVLRERYPQPAADDDSRDARMMRYLHEGPKLKPELAAYPAHLHIDLLPEAQGQGLGRELISTFTQKLRELAAPALHLEVGKRNPGAIAFYQRVGFQIIAEYEFSIAFGMNL
jgi:ribosomal protein S18 acetylase RimI-like enzyme